MEIPSGKNVAILSTPPTFVEERLCPLGLVPIGILKLTAFLKKNGNHVSYINMHSGDAGSGSSVIKPGEVCQWKEKPLGVEGARRAMMSISGKSPAYLARRLKDLERHPHEIWISCSFTFDYDLVREYVGIARRVHPSARIVVGGDFVRLSPELAKLTGADAHCSERVPGADLCAPDFSSEAAWTYGLFQLQVGCINKCSFCAISMDKPQKFGVDGVLGYMREFYDRYKPSCFYNWDPNVALYPHQLEEFLDKYIASGMSASLGFGKGLQPDLVNERILKKMAAARSLATLPMECANYAAASRLNKPYTIISSIKLLDMAKRAGLRLADCNCTSLLGYPDDDLGSFFRIYVSILKFGALPAPFPVSIFPGTPDYRKYRGLIKHKDLGELHGQLWPLLPEKDADKYIDLFKFIKLTHPSGVKENLGLLTADLKAVLLRELATSDKFIDLCLNAKKDTLDEFRKIERELTVKKARRTRNILYIVANPTPLEKSASRQLGEHFLSTYIKASPRAKVTVLDLCEEGLPFINREYVEMVYYKEKPAALSPETKKLVALAEKYIQQLREADEVVIVSPMYTLSVPAILKAYLELVASRLFYFYNKKMLDPKPVVCILTRDGIYPPGGRVYAAGYPYMNVQEVLLTAAVSFLGLSNNIKFITAAGGGDKERLQKTFSEARRAIEAYVAEMTAGRAAPVRRPE